MGILNSLEHANIYDFIEKWNERREFRVDFFTLNSRYFLKAAVKLNKRLERYLMPLIQTILKKNKVYY
jgi:hypothetical protein